MKKSVFFLAFFLSMFISGNLFAAVITLQDVTLFTANGTNPGSDLDGYGWGDVNRLDCTGDYVAWTHHFAFDPPAQSLINATLTLNLIDDETDATRGLLKSLTWEYAAGFAESWQWDFGEVDTGPYTYDINVSYLADGAFSIMLASVWGDFSINSSVLNINYNSADAAPVPEPATLLLLGGGLLGLSGLRRKRR